MDNSTQKGKTIVIGIIAAVILVCIFNIVLVNTIAPTPYIQGGIRLLLTSILCYYLYQGYSWAYWTMGALLSLTGFIAVPRGFFLLGQSTVTALWLVVVGVVYLGCSWLLLRSPEVKAFMAQQRSHRNNHQT